MEIDAFSRSVQIKTGIIKSSGAKGRISGARLKCRLDINSRNKQTIERSVRWQGNAFCPGQLMTLKIGNKLWVSG